jgi:AcrR family transcriptional regulator
MSAPAKTAQRRNKCFDETHQDMIKTTASLIAEKGIESVSIAAVARAMGVNRTTVYYHFDSREKLINEVKAWSSDQLSQAFRRDMPRQDRIEHIYHFVLDNPELIKLWLDDLMSVGDIRQLYPHWDELVNGIREHFVGSDFEETIDPEVFCVNLLASAFVGPRVFKHSVCPTADNEVVVKRFKDESMRMLASLSLA